MNETAIVIEDDEFGNETLSELLETYGIKVVVRGSNGKEAIDLFGKHNPPYSIIGLLKPNYDGFFAIKGIQKINKESQILVLTEDTSLESKKKLDYL